MNIVQVTDHQQQLLTSWIRNIPEEARTQYLMMYMPDKALLPFQQVKVVIEEDAQKIKENLERSIAIKAEEDVPYAKLLNGTVPDSLDHQTVKKILELRRSALNFTETQTHIEFSEYTFVIRTVLDQKEMHRFEISKKDYVQWMERGMFIVDKIGGYDIDESRVIASYLCNFFDWMYYISEQKPMRVEHRVLKSIQQKKGSKKGGKKQPTRVIKIQQNIYSPYIDDAFLEEEKRNYTRITESWGVRGHWREYKSGKRVWIAPHKKGNTAAEKPVQHYKIRLEDN